VLKKPEFQNLASKSQIGNPGIAHANKLVGHTSFSQSYLGHVSKKVEKHCPRRCYRLRAAAYFTSTVSAEHCTQPRSILYPPAESMPLENAFNW